MKKGHEQSIRTRPTPARLVIYGVALGGVLLVLHFTLAPFYFTEFDRIYQLHHYFGGLKFGGYSRCCTHLAVLEPLANAVLFMPFGFGLTGVLRKKTATWTKAFIFVLLLSLGLSLMVEVLQVFQPWRSPSLTDLLMNSLGGVFGFLCFRAGGQALMRVLSRPTGKKRPHHAPRR